jgi:hypothetical protein
MDYAHMNSRVLMDAGSDPSGVEISHIVHFQGVPVRVDEWAIDAARDPYSKHARLMQERIDGLANSPDPEQQMAAFQARRCLAAAHAIRSVVFDPAQYNAVVSASDNGDENALMVRQGVVAARIADVKDGALKLAVSVAQGDKAAYDRAMQLHQFALGGDKVATAGCAVFAKALQQLLKQAKPPDGSSITTEGQAVAESVGRADVPPQVPALGADAAKDPMAGQPIGPPSDDPDLAALAWIKQQQEGLKPPAEAVSKGRDPQAEVGTISSSEGGVGAPGKAA